MISRLRDAGIYFGSPRKDDEPDSSMYTWRWWTSVKERIDDVAQTDKCEYWPRLTNHVAYWKRRSIVLGRFLSYGTSLSFPTILVVMNWFWRCRDIVEFEIAVSGKRTASSWLTMAMVVKGCCNTKSLMKACMSSVRLMLQAPPSASLCTRPSANQTRMMLRAVWYGMPRRAASS